MQLRKWCWSPGLTGASALMPADARWQPSPMRYAFAQSATAPDHKATLVR